MPLNKLTKYFYDELISLIHYYLKFLRFRFIHSSIPIFRLINLKIDKWYQKLDGEFINLRLSSDY